MGVSKIALRSKEIDSVAYGIPFLGENNIEKWHRILKQSKDTQSIKQSETQLLKLISSIEEKTKLVVIDGQYLTWLEDIRFDYIKHICYTPYLKFDSFSQDIVRNVDKNKGHNHIDYFEYKDTNSDNDYIQFLSIKYNFEYLIKQVKIGDSLIIYDLKNDEIQRYIISSWVNHQDKNDISVFSLKRLYNLYKEYCFYDMITEFSGHESGYTYISIESQRLKNTEKTIRKKLGLNDWVKVPNIKSHRDVRVYKYFDYINRLKKSEHVGLQHKLFKYRRLRFDSYLYCHFMNKSVPCDIDDFPEWNKLGISSQYIKISDGNLPFFIKAEWKPDNKLNINKTWRKAQLYNII